ncbi:MAG TPA: hypothetical protein VMN78_13110 [Longimicrobiales bacterium]|nr:hypothetical protein [Longimicrobiales bacterium]
MPRLLFASLVAVAMQSAPAPLLGQERVQPVSNAGVITQSVVVPVFPGQMITATVALPALEATPLPSVLLLVVREPDSGPVVAAVAMSEALLARGIAVVQLELPPVSAADSGRAEPMTQPADDAYAVLQFLRQRQDIDGDRMALIGVGEAAPYAARAAALDEGVRALVLLGAGSPSRDSMDLPTSLPLLALPLEPRAAPPEGQASGSPAIDAAAFLSRHLQ